MQSVSATLARGMELLAQRSPSARADAQLLLAFALGRRREWLLAHGDTALTDAQAKQYAALCQRRATGVPLAYITGFAGFYGREFAVNEHVLIPRPETEHLVEDALAYLREIAQTQGKRVFTVFEAGVGSGAIACSIAAECAGVALQGTDASPHALEVAQHNARRLNVQTRCKFALGDVVNDGELKPYDLVIANLPYIPSADVPRVPDPVGYEPLLALDGGADGLDLYRKLLAAAPKLLRPGALLLMEAAPPTIDALARLTREALPEARTEARRDYAGQERYLYVRTPGGR